MNYNEQQLQTRRWRAAQQPAAAVARDTPGAPDLASHAHACGDRTELLMRAMLPADCTDTEGAVGASLYPP